MPTPFDRILQRIHRRGYHNHRLEDHSDLLTDQIVSDLADRCQAFAEDQARPRFRGWHNVQAADGRNTDFIFGPVRADGPANLFGDARVNQPDLSDVRLLIEHKSVITAHRNRHARVQDIEREMRATYHHNPRTIVVATVLIGTCLRVLNVPDCVRRDPRYDVGAFEAQIVPRLSSGDETLWDEFNHCVSRNTNTDPMRTVDLFRRHLPRRAVDDADEEQMGIDYLLLVPVAIDNVNPPRLSTLDDIDPCAAYDDMIQHICRTYRTRWHGR